MKQIEFLFDYVSPFAYLAHHQMKSLKARHDVEIIHRPILLGGLFGLAGSTSPLNEPCAPKREYFMKSLGRWVSYHQAPFQMSPVFPFRSIGLLRMALKAQELDVFDRYHDAIFQAAWAEGRDMNDEKVLLDILEGAGLDAQGIIQGAKEEAIKEKLKTETQRAADEGAFGVPSFFVDGELYWGQDHLLLLEHDLVQRSKGPDKAPPDPVSLGVEP